MTHARFKSKFWHLFKFQVGNKQNAENLKLIIRTKKASMMVGNGFNKKMNDYRANKNKNGSKNSKKKWQVLLVKKDVC